MLHGIPYGATFAALRAAAPEPAVPPARRGGDGLQQVGGAVPPAREVRVDEKIDAYLSSWWHRTADLLKPVPAATSWWDGWFGGGGAEATERSTCLLYTSPSPRDS